MLCIGVSIVILLTISSISSRYHLLVASQEPTTILKILGSPYQLAIFNKDDTLSFIGNSFFSLHIHVFGISLRYGHILLPGLFLGCY